MEHALAADVMMRFGIAAPLRKPVDPDELLALLHRHLPRRAF